MNNDEFENIVHLRTVKMKEVLNRKCKEYGLGDKLYNFKRASGILKNTPAEALIGMFVKHMVSVLDLAEGKVFPTQYLIDEKIGDAINYMVLLEAILIEEMEDRGDS